MQWYEVDTDKLPAEISTKFIQMEEDETTKQFLDNCYLKADWIITQLMHLTVKAALGFIMTNTSING